MTTRQEKERRRLQRRKTSIAGPEFAGSRKGSLDRRERGGRREDDITGPKWLK
ncbi:hypothetical protein MBH78_02195 [Oceanimonas sp. NS1]|nr:hypothetical protein [Oceanimonas sp. NS1]